ncbi:MAG: FAD-binding protein [Defluviitaleaceae bacterium]|nr:FAD-binding protein [Defluviitaleaceae bacterium]
MKSQYHTLVIGSGAAGFNAADWLYDLGVQDIALITEGINMGTSRNTGSDKQTYYKLTLAGDEPDSVCDMASTLFQGGSMHGDTAMVQAACSTKAFMKLVRLGLPFPTNQYGAYVGYKTDHDPKQRATSCGPLTSKFMTQALEKEVIRKGIEILDGYRVIKLLTHKGRITGLVALGPAGYKTLQAQNIIMATGGPAGIYANTVFPKSQTGATGLALNAGAQACNLQEWQYGLASIDFPWNVSGTYQQVLPKYISIDSQGNEREFLPHYYTDPTKALDNVFLKGYQWPFDIKKIDGSSQIDLIVAKENEQGRTVYMDFRQNPTGLDYNRLSPETYIYLEKSNALFGTPIQRLEKMNPKAIALYKANGIDLYNEPLKVAVCAQHCNGGIAVDINWESNIKGLYVIGEAAGTFGVYRPGGSALNDTQVGAMRAAEHIAQKKPEAAKPTPDFDTPTITYSNQSNLSTKRQEIQARMSRHAAYIRDPKEMASLFEELIQLKENFFKEITIASENELLNLFTFHDTLTTQIAALSAMIYAANEIGSRGSALVKDQPQPSDIHNNQVVITENDKSYVQPVRPLPPCDDWFENIYSK